MSTTKASTEGESAPQNKPSPADVAQAASKEILKKADEKIDAAKASTLLLAEDDQLGRSADNDTSKNPTVQRDTLPGTRRPDMTYLPEQAYDAEEDRDRRTTLPKDYHYCWVADALVQRFRTLGYKFCLYNGGSQSGLADRGFKGTGLFESTLSKHVRNGDTVLMFTDMRLYEHLSQMDRDQVDKWNRAAQGDLHNLGYRYGIRTFEEDKGEIKYN